MDWLSVRATAVAEDAAMLGFAAGVALVEVGVFVLDFGCGAAPEDLELDAAVWEWVEEELLDWVWTPRRDWIWVVVGRIACGAIFATSEIDNYIIICIATKNNLPIDNKRAA